MNCEKRLRSKSKGSAIILVVLVVVLLAAMGAGMLSLGLRGRILAVRNAQNIEARCAADAGLTKAIFKLNEKLTAKALDGGLPSATSESLPNSDAAFSYKVDSKDSSGKVVEDIHDLTVNCIGQSGPARKNIAATLRLQGLFEYAILSKGDIILKSDTVISGYNSEDPNDTDVDLQIATTSTAPDQIILNTGVVIDGEVVVGVDADPAVVIKDLGGSTGGTYSMTQEQVYPEVDPPVLADKGKIFVEGVNTVIDGNESGRYSSLEVLQVSQKIKGVTYVDYGKLIIDDGEDVVLHITGNITLGQGCDIVIPPDSFLTIYLDGDMTCGNNSGIDNQTGRPGNVKLYGTGDPVQKWDIKAKSDAFGAIYAPNADITIHAKGDIGSSIVGNSVEFKSGGNFLYDEDLREVDLDDVGVRFIVKRWSEQ
jgi:hypothetical protein